MCRTSLEIRDTCSCPIRWLLSHGTIIWDFFCALSVSLYFWRFCWLDKSYQKGQFFFCKLHNLCICLVHMAGVECSHSLGRFSNSRWNRILYMTSLWCSSNGCFKGIAILDIYRDWLFCCLIHSIFSCSLIPLVTWSLSL